MSRETVFRGAKEIVDEMTNRGNFNDVAERLAFDAQNMNRADYQRLLNHIEVLQDNRINTPEGRKDVKMHIDVDSDHLQKNGFPTVTLIDDGIPLHILSLGTKVVNDPQSELAGKAMVDGNSDKIETR